MLRWLSHLIPDHGLTSHIAMLSKLENLKLKDIGLRRSMKTSTKDKVNIFGGDLFFLTRLIIMELFKEKRR